METDHADWGCEKNPLSAPINRSIRCLNGVSSGELGVSSGELFGYTHVNGVSYGGWFIKEEEFEETNCVKILQLT